MKQGQKPAEPRMEDVLASIRRAIDENAATAASPERFAGSMAELRVKIDNPPARAESRPRRDYDYNGSTHTTSHQPQGFAGILGGRREAVETGFRDRVAAYETRPRRPDPVVPDAQEQYVYDSYYGAPVADYVEPASEPEAEPYPPVREEMTPPRYLPPAAVAEPPQDYADESGLMSESSSAATQAAFNQLAETITRRALGDRPISDIAQELLRGMLKQWLDEHLPTIVERLVREEIERVVRRPSR